MVSMHSSPVSPAGSGDSGGMNISIVSVASELAKRGVEVDLLTRGMGSPATTVVGDGVTLYELEAGPPGPLAKEQMVEVTDESSTGTKDCVASGAATDSAAVTPNPPTLCWP